MQSASKRHEFKAVVDGIDLPAHVAERISRAVQRAVLNEVAELDLRENLNVQLTIPASVVEEARIVNGGRTSGIYLSTARE
jgi:hypothetical protein